MSNSTSPFGDRPIDFSAPEFSLAEAARLATLEEKTVRNWIARGVMPVGKKIGGRWGFTFLDVLAMRVASYLTNSLYIEPSVAAKIAPEAARYVQQRAIQSSERNPATGNLREMETGVRHWQNIIITFESGNARFWLAGCDPSRMMPPHYSEVEAAALRRPYFLIPADAMIADLIYDLEALFQQRLSDD